MPSASEPRRRALPELAAERPVGAIAIVLALTILGAIAFYTLPVNLMPDIVYPMVRVQIAAGDTAPEILVNTITRPLEQELAQAEALETMESTTERGQVQITLSFHPDRDVDEALKDVSGWVDRARGRLPAGLAPPTIFKFDPQNLPVLEFVLNSAAIEMTALRQFAEQNLAYRFTGVAGVSGVRVAGGQLREIQVRVDPHRLRSHGLTLPDLAAALERSNLQTPAGRVDALGAELSGQTVALFTDPKQIASARITPAARVRDVAEVADTRREQRLIVSVNGVEGVKLSIFKIPGANSVDVAEAARARVASLLADGAIPAGVSAEITADESVYIRDSIGSARHALLLALSLVALTVLVFLKDWKFTLVAIVVLPIALAAAALPMRVFGVSLNLMSIGGLIVGVGLLADYGIVLLENMTRHWAGGQSVREAVVAASREVAGPLAASVTVLGAALAPFLLFGGLALLFFGEFIQVILFATVAGLLAAFVFIPAIYPLASRFIRHGQVEEGAALQAISSAYRAMLGFCLRHRHSVIALALLAATAAGAGITKLGYIFLPEIDDGRVTIAMQGDPGMPLTELTPAVARLARAAKDDPAVVLVDVSDGGRVGQTIQEGRPEAEILVQLVPKTNRPLTVQRWMADFDDTIKGLKLTGLNIRVRKARIRAIRTFSGSSAFGDFDVVVRVQGSDPRVLAQLGQQAQARIRDVSGLSQLTTSLVTGQPMVDFAVDRDKAALYGLTPAAAARTLEMAIGGVVASRLLEDGLFYDIRVMNHRQGSNFLSQLPALPVERAANGGFVLLGQIAELRIGSGPVAIDRIDQATVNMVTGAARGRVLSDVAADVRERMRDFPLPAGYSISYGGRMAALGADGGGSLWLGALALLLILVTLAVQFESMGDAAIVLAVLPLGVCGSVAALSWSGAPLSSTAIIGMVLVIGIAGNNAVVLTAFVRQLREQGRSLHDAVLWGATQRLRPKLMTSIVTIAGTAPLAIGREEGSEILQPLAIVVLGGVPASLIATLLVLPCLYYAVHRLQLQLRDGVGVG